MNPSATRKAPVKVGELELSLPIEPITACEGFHAVRLLVRGFGRPLGWLTIDRPDASLGHDRIRGALMTQGADLLARWERLPPPPVPPPAPPISVVVCTRDRAALLRHCLASLAAVEYPRFEVIVVDNASATAETASVAEEARVRLVREAMPGLDWARNRGVEVARYDLIAFTDDDARVDRGWLSGLAEAFREPEVALVTGLVAPSALDTEAQLVFEDDYGGMGKGFVRRRWHPSETQWIERLAANQLGVGANMAFRRGAWERVGGFDTALDVGTPSRGGGDLDFFHRILVAGLVVRYEPGALVWHTHRRDVAGLRRQLRDNGRAFATYLMTQWSAAGGRRGAVTRGRVTRYGIFIGLRLAALVLFPLRGRARVGSRLALEELLGFLSFPAAYLATRRNDRRLRRRASSSHG